MKIRLTTDGEEHSVPAEMTPRHVVALLGKDPDEWGLRRTKDETYVGETGRVGDLVSDG